jgi:uncharacterized membrane protein YfcA
MWVVHHTWLELLLASLVMAVGAVVQGSVGFGLNVIGAPLLVLIDTAFIPGPALAAAFVLTILVGLRDRHAIDTKGFAWIFAGRLPSSIATAFFVASLPEATLAVALAAVVLVAVGMALFGFRVERTPATLASAGALSGVMGTISSVGGPPVAMLYQDVRGPTVRSTLSAIFAMGAVTSMVMLGLVGRFATDELLLALVLVPGVVVGFLISRFTAHLLDRGFMRPAVLGLSAASAIAAIARYV